MRSKDDKRRDAIRLLLSAIKQIEVDNRVSLDDAQIVAIIEKELKKRKDSLSQYTSAGRMDLAEQEQFEIGVLSIWLPTQASVEEVMGAIDKAIAESGGGGKQAMGKVMQILRTKLAGRADMGMVSAEVKKRLT